MDSKLLSVLSYPNLSVRDLCKALGTLNVYDTPLQVWVIRKIGKYRRLVLDGDVFLDLDPSTLGHSSSLAMRMAQDFKQISRIFDELEISMSEDDNSRAFFVFQFYEKLFANLLLDQEDFPKLTPRDLEQIKNKSSVDARFRFVQEVLDCELPFIEINKLMESLFKEIPNEFLTFEKPIFTERNTLQK